MSGREIVAWLEGHGIKMSLDANGIRLNGPVEKLPGLAQRLKANRDTIAEYLKWRDHVDPPEFEVRFATGHISPHSFPQNGWPTGAREYRKIGTDEWLPVPQDQALHLRRLQSIAQWSAVAAPGGSHGQPRRSKKAAEGAERALFREERTGAGY